ncbi:MAG: hypothetical protein K9N23_23535 [Akkermansiaceae bacterium]|nr:hypothetical protein [Akkermansiaceae bacterium]
MIRRRTTILVSAAALLGAAALWWHHAGRRAAPAPPVAPAASVLRSIAAPTLPADAAAELRPAVAKAVVEVPAGGWNERLDRVRQLPDDLSSGEIESLLAALMEPRPAGVSAVIHSTCVHEVACILQRQPAARQRFAEALATIARDPHRDPVTRDYAIQHLRQVWDNAGETPALREAVTNTFREFVGLDPTVSTPALLSLHLLASDSPENAGCRLADDEFPALRAPVFAPATTIENLPPPHTAVLTVDERRLQDYRQTLLDQVANRSEHALLRMAAANALGRIARAEDLAALAALDPGDGRVATAIQHALHRSPTH